MCRRRNESENEQKTGVVQGLWRRWGQSSPPKTELNRTLQAREEGKNGDECKHFKSKLQFYVLPSITHTKQYFCVSSIFALVLHFLPPVLKTSRHPFAFVPKYWHFKTCRHGATIRKPFRCILFYIFACYAFYHSNTSWIPQLSCFVTSQTLILMSCYFIFA